MGRIWFITGVSSGLGRALAQAVLASGDTVAGTVRKAADAEAFGQLFANSDAVACLRRHERLGIGVAGDKLHASDLGADHAVHGVAAATANTNKLNIGQ